MAIKTTTAAYISQLGLLQFVDPSGGPEGPHGTVAYRLVPAGGWHNSQRFPHDVHEDLKGQNFDKVSLEGIDYWMVPDDTSNTPGTISHYAQRTGVADLANPIGDQPGYNRARDSFDQVDYASHTAAPGAVAKYVKENDNFEEARQRTDAFNERVLRQIGHGQGTQDRDAKASERNK